MKKFRFLLLDAGPIIKLFSLGIWDDFTKHCDVSISRIIANNEALYTEDRTKQIGFIRLMRILPERKGDLELFREKYHLGRGPN
jgi:hypothetical protein